jgi:nucleotide-binding universal stress UspA family protein
MLFRRILFPTDYSERSRKALGYAGALARDQGALLVILHAVETLGPENVTYGEMGSQLQPEGYRQRLWADLHRVRPPQPGVQIEYVLSEEDPVAAILATAVQHKCDLIVMGSHGRSGIKHFLLGSVAEKVVRRAPCPVLVIKDPWLSLQPPEDSGTANHPHFLTEEKPGKASP